MRRARARACPPARSTRAVPPARSRDCARGPSARSPQRRSPRRPALAPPLAVQVATCSRQGFDPLARGFAIAVKKNGRILRRTAGLPPWDALVGTMEVMDGSKFGMPGDGDKYGNAARELASLRDGESDS